MKISYIIETCRDKISPQCTGTFQREVKRGRPQVDCDACKAFKKKPAAGAAKLVTDELGKGQCPCGNVFDVPSGRGRKPSKCHDCRTAGTVYRKDDDGVLQTIQKDQLDREQQERDAEAGRERAQNLFERMQPLLAKTNRTVIPH